jgi:hypothetical protein
LFITSSIYGSQKIASQKINSRQCFSIYCIKYFYKIQQFVKYDNTLYLHIGESYSINLVE